MSMHHQRILQRYGLGRPGNLYSAVNLDPIFGTILTSFFVNTLGFSAVAGSIAASVTTAITTGGGYNEWRFTHERS